MNRRSFFKALGALAATGALTQKALAKLAEEAPMTATEVRARRRLHALRWKRTVAYRLGYN